MRVQSAIALSNQAQAMLSTGAAKGRWRRAQRRRRSLNTLTVVSTIAIAHAQSRQRAIARSALPEAIAWR